MYVAHLQQNRNGQKNPDKPPLRRSGIDVRLISHISSNVHLVHTAREKRRRTEKFLSCVCLFIASTVYNELDITSLCVRAKFPSEQTSGERKGTFLCVQASNGGFSVQNEQAAHGVIFHDLGP